MQRGEEIPCGFGYDESNNGRYPSIHVLSYSRIPQDFSVFPESRLLLKQRTHKKVNDRLRTPQRDYSFLLFTESDRDRVKDRHKVLGVILGSLLFKEPIAPPFEIYVDGERYEREIDYAYKCIREVTGVGRKQVTINFGANYDRRVPVVNLADEIANWLLRKKASFETLRDSGHRKPLILEKKLKHHNHRKPVIPIEALVGV